MARAYRKKPVVVEAVQWTGENHAEMCEFIDPEVFEIIPRVGLVIHTLEGDHHASPGDYIIKGVNGEFYPCKPDIFAKTYESSTLTPPNDPLTIKQLQKMVGEPVYDYLGQEWYVIQEYYDHELTMTDGTRFFDDDEIDGVDKRFYRRPPEGEEDT